MNSFHSAVQVGAEWVSVELIGSAASHQVVANEERVAAVVRVASVAFGENVVRAAVWSDSFAGRVWADVFGADRGAGEVYRGRLALVSGPWREVWELYHRAGAVEDWRAELAGVVASRIGWSLYAFAEIVGADWLDEQYRAGAEVDRVVDRAINRLGYEVFVGPEPVVEFVAEDEPGVEPVEEPVVADEVVEVFEPVVIFVVYGGLFGLAAAGEAEAVAEVAWSAADEALWQAEIERFQVEAAECGAAADAGVAIVEAKDAVVEEAFFLSEYEQGWKNIHDEQLADVLRQNREDEEYARRPRSSYQGVQGSWNPDDGWIYEP